MARDKKTKGPKVVSFRKASSLDESFRYRLKKRSSVSGIALEAIGGEKDCISMLAGYGVVIMEQVAETAPVDLAQAAWWLAWILSKIQDGVEPNEAFGYKQKKKRILPPKKFAVLQKEWRVGRTVAVLVDDFKEKSFDECVTIVAKLYGVEDSAVKESITSCASDARKVPVREVALDVICAFGVGDGSSIMPGRDAAVKAYKAYRKQG